MFKDLNYLGILRSVLIFQNYMQNELILRFVIGLSFFTMRLVFGTYQDFSSFVEFLGLGISFRALFELFRHRKQPNFVVYSNFLLFCSTLFQFFVV